MKRFINKKNILNEIPCEIKLKIFLAKKKYDCFFKNIDNNTDLSIYLKILISNHNHNIEQIILLFNYANNNNHKFTNIDECLILAYKNNDINKINLLFNYANENNYKFTNIDECLKIAYTNNNIEQLNLLFNYANENNYKFTNICRNILKILQSSNNISNNLELKILNSLVMNYHNIPNLNLYFESCCRNNKRKVVNFLNKYLNYYTVEYLNNTIHFYKRNYDIFNMIQTPQNYQEYLSKKKSDDIQCLICFSSEEKNYINYNCYNKHEHYYCFDCLKRYKNRNI